MERVAGKKPSDNEVDAMIRILSNEYNLLTARVFLGVLFVVISIDKIADPAAFARSISDYRIVTGTPAMVLATVLPWVELLCGLALAFGILLRGSSLLIGSLLIVFTFAVASALLRDLDISCGCFTQDPSADRIGWLKIGENIVLLALAAYLFLSRNHRFSLDEYVRSFPPRS